MRINIKCLRLRVEVKQFFSTSGKIILLFSFNIVSKCSDRINDKLL